MGKKSRDPRDERNAWRLEEEAAREQMHLQRLERVATDGGRGSGVASSAKRGPQDATDASAQPAGEQGKKKKRKGKPKREGGHSFEVVPLGFSAGSVAGGAAVARPGEEKREAARPGGKAPPRGPNTLRDAHRVATGSGKGKGSAADRKANEIWFRKCGHGARLFSEYYQGQPGVVPAEQWAAFEDILDVPLPVTFRLHSLTAGGGGPQGRQLAEALAMLRAGLEEDLALLADIVRPVPWAPDEGIYQVSSSCSFFALSRS